MSGGKGGSETQKTEIPEWAESAMKQNLRRAADAQQIGYTPYMGPDVAAFNPTQQAAMQSNIQAAQAFGLAPQGMTAGQGMPAPTTYAGGMQGYSGMPLYEQALAEVQARSPEQARAYENLFVNRTRRLPYVDNSYVPVDEGQNSVTGDVTFRPMRRSR